MRILDTNTILRYLLNDNERQASVIAEIIRTDVCTTTEVIAEATYVLSSVYKIPRNDISWMIHCVLLDVKVDNLKSVRYALGLYNQTNLGFVDCLFVAYHKVLGLDVLSFDRKLNSCLEKEYQIHQIEPPDLSD